jgi:hypothetical protein
MSPTPSLVTEALSKIYYKGLPSEPPLVATTNPSPFEYPTGPEAYSVLKELRELGDHPSLVLGTTIWPTAFAVALTRCA